MRLATGGLMCVPADVRNQCVQLPELVHRDSVPVKDRRRCAALPLLLRAELRYHHQAQLPEIRVREVADELTLNGLDAGRPKTFSAVCPSNPTGWIRFNRPFR